MTMRQSDREREQENGELCSVKNDNRAHNMSSLGALCFGNHRAPSPSSSFWRLVQQLRRHPFVTHSSRHNNQKVIMGAEGREKKRKIKLDDKRKKGRNIGVLSSPPDSVWHFGNVFLPHLRLRTWIIFDISMFMKLSDSRAQHRNSSACPLLSPQHTRKRPRSWWYCATSGSHAAKWGPPAVFSFSSLHSLQLLYYNIGMDDNATTGAVNR